MSIEQGGNRGRDFQSRTREAFTGNRFNRRSQQLKKRFDQHSQLNSVLKHNEGVTGKTAIQIEDLKLSLKDVHVQDWTNQKFLKEILTVINAGNRELAATKRRIQAETIVEIKKEMIGRIRSSQLKEQYRAAVERGIQAAEVAPGDKTVIEIITELINSIIDSLAAVNLRPSRGVATAIMAMFMIAVPILTACAPSVEASEPDPAIVATAESPEIEPTVATEIVYPEEVETGEPEAEPTATVEAKPTPTTPVTESSVRSKIEEKIESLSDDEKEIAKDTIDPQGIDEFITVLTNGGVIGSIVSEEDIEINPVTGQIAYHADFYKVSEDEFLKDVYITSSMIEGDNNPLFTSLNGAKQAAMDNPVWNINPDDIEEVRVFENGFRSTALDKDENVLLAVSGPNKEFPEKTGQWMPPEDAKPDEAKKTDVENEIDLSNWDNMTQEEQMQKATEVLINMGVDVERIDTTVVTFHPEEGIIRAEDGRVIECPYDINDIWNGENLEKYVGKLTEETEAVRNWGEIIGKGNMVTVGKKYVPIIWGDTMSTYKDIGTSTLIDVNGKELTTRTINAEIIIPSEKGNFGVIKPINIDVPYQMIAVRGLLDGETRYSQREEYFLGYEYDGSNEALSSENWPKIAKEMKIDMGVNEVMLLAVAIDNGDVSFYIKNIDGEPPCTDEEILQRNKALVLHTKPSENVFVPTSEKDLQELRNNFSGITDEIIIPGIFTIGKYR